MGLHRMGLGSAKIAELQEIKTNFRMQEVREHISNLECFEITNIQEDNTMI